MPLRRSRSSLPRPRPTTGTTFTTVYRSTKRRAPIPGRVIKRGCIAARSHHEEAARDYSAGVWRGDADALQDPRGVASLHLERLRERSRWPLSRAAGRTVADHRAGRGSTARAARKLSRFQRLSADRLADAQTCPGVAGTNRVSNRAHDRGRRYRPRPGARARWSRPAIAGLAGMPSDRGRRNLPHELAIGQLA